MHKKDKELIQSKLNEWFKGIRKKLNYEKNLTSSQVREAQQIQLDQLIQHQWESFRETFNCTIHKFSSTERREYIEYLEEEFAQYADRLNADYGEFYKIKIRPKTKIVVLPPRKIESTATRAEAAEMHIHVYKKLKGYWQSNFSENVDEESLWGHLYLSLIYFSGCSSPDMLSSLSEVLQEALSKKSLESFRLYQGNNLKDNPIILHLKVKNDSYGNDFEKDQLYQWAYVYLNPWTQFFLQALSLRMGSHNDKETNTDIKHCILKSLSHLEQTEYVIKLCSLLRKKELNAFQFVQMALQFDKELKLDIFLGNVLAQNINTVALRPQEHIFLSATAAAIQGIELKNIKIEQEQLHAKEDELVSINEKLKSIPFKIQLFENIQPELVQQGGIKRYREHNNNFYDRYIRIQEELEQKFLQANSEEKNLIQAQLRLIAWVFHLRKKDLKVASITKYLSCFAKDFIFEVWFRKIDLDKLSEEDYTDLYQQLLWNCRERDEKAKKKDEAKSSRKGHNSEAYRFGRIKAFHAFCCEKFKTPEVKLLKQTKYKHMQITNARIISPSMFNKMLSQLDLLGNINQSWYEHITPLKLIYVLSFRLGLRLNEVRCLTLEDVICPELTYSNLSKNKLKNIRLCIQNNPYRRLKTPNAHRQLPIRHLLMKKEFEIFKEFLKNRYIQWKNNKNDHLLFNHKGQVLTESCITQVTSTVLKTIYGENHGYSFHSLRHSAANMLAILLGGSPNLIHTYTDYSMRQVKNLRELFFGQEAYLQQDMIQHKWRALASWMGHSSIEQTASNYCHVLELIAIDRIINSNYMIHKQVLQKCLGIEADNDEFKAINNLLKIPEFKWMCIKKNEIKVQKTVSAALKVKKVQLNPLDRIMAVKERYLDDEQAKLWLRRCSFLSKKWIEPKSFNLDYQDFIPDENEIFFDDLYDRCKKLKLIQPKEVLIAIKEEADDILKQALQVLMTDAKQRKNFLHFQIRESKQENYAKSNTDSIQSKEQNVKVFITGVSRVLEKTVMIDIDDLASDSSKKEKIQRISFIRKEDNKNITLAVLLHLMIMAVQLEEAW
ncbi:integrase (plasmid) [Acinetobacter sp. LoGeW2-3]|uniref:site-specific integrase n=1 Tax=Acinetobacter sp. LoGeW2-3 TaxID=1808001 RepID=UPI000C05861A|nr:site-specific integrase [Acinetobacter sp. LoGeW2-3]ATO21161.1 integrase [Acinetobacter sp. LoGeW2-3]